MFPEVGVPERPPQVPVGAGPGRVEVEPEGAGEEHRVLGYDGQAGAEAAEAHAGDVHAVDQDLEEAIRA